MPRFEIKFLDDYTDESLLDELRRVAAQCSEAHLSLAAYSRLSPRVAADTLRKRFGTWGRALEKAGIGHLYAASKHFADEQCFENLANVWTHLGRCPTFSEMKRPPSAIGPDKYKKRWGTWRGSLKAFVEWANAEGQASTPETDADAESVPNHLGPVKIANKAEDRREVRPGLKFKVLMRDRFRCVACGRSPATHLDVELHADHVISVYEGGKTVYENLQTLCKECNLGKGRTSVR
jgi:hypothetical protein